MKSHITLMLLTWWFYTASVTAQREDYIWYFGHGGTGLDFNQCDPIVLTDGFTDSYMWEGAATIADPNTGELLFYTSGVRAYNADRQIMLDGDPIGLSNSLSQMVIIPWPGTTSKYFLFLPEVQAGISWMPNHEAAFSLHYAVIDMDLDGGLGAVESKFNVLLQTQHCEFMTAVPHANGTDIWLIGHEFNNDAFFKYLITDTGISLPAIIQNIGPVVSTPQPGTPNTSNFDAIGSMRASVDGSKLAFTTMYNGITSIFDFDRETGMLSDPIVLSLSGGGLGLSFSPNGSNLYVSIRHPDFGTDFQNGRLIQFDLTAGSPEEIQNSSTIIHENNGPGGFVTLKLGPDQRLYVARVGSNGTISGDDHLGVIENPDNPGIACSYVHDGIYLNGNTGSWGLNNSFETGNNCKMDQLSIQVPLESEVEIITFGNTVNVKWPSNREITSFSVHTLDGKIVYESSIALATVEHDWTFENVGCYLIRLKGNEQQLVRKLVLL